MRIGIKIGSNLLANGNGEINNQFILEVCRQAAWLNKNDNDVFIVTSGAVASDPKKQRSKNLRAGIGQPRLMNKYTTYLEIFGIEASQHLLTDRNVLGRFSTRTKETLLEAFREKVIPIINGNDTVDDKELNALEFCADNDVLFKSVCILIEADIAIIGLGEKGLLDQGGKVIYEARINEIDKLFRCAQKGSELGHGSNGMVTKIRALTELTQRKITAILAPGKEEDFILRAFAGEKDFGTRFV